MADALFLYLRSHHDLPVEVTSPSTRSGLLVSLAVSTVLAAGGCSDPATGPSSTAPTVAVSLTVAGPVQVFDRADRLAVRVVASNVVLLDTVIEFRSNGGDVRVRLRSPDGSEGGTAIVQVELRLGSTPLFTGSAPAPEISSGSAEPVAITLQPVIAAIVVPATATMIPAIGGTAPLSAAAVFATGDTIPDVLFTWTSLDPGIVTVTADGTARGRAEGTGRVEVRAGNVAAVATVIVRATVASVTLVPDRVTIVIGAVQSFTAIPRDAAGNALIRTFAWSSSDAAVLSVDNTGRAVAQAAGTATIRATTDNVSGTAAVTVVVPLPAKPTSLAAQAAGTSISLTWVDNATDELSYEVHRGVGGSTQRIRVATLGPDARAYTDNAPGPDLVLEYVVMACNIAGCSPSSPITTETVPLPPINFLLIVVDSLTGTIQLSWLDASQTEAEFFIEIGDSDFFWSFYDAIPANSTSYTTTIPFDQYLYFRVAACNKAGCSDPTIEIFVYLQSPSPASAPPMNIPLVLTPAGDESE